MHPTRARLIDHYLAYLATGDYDREHVGFKHLQRIGRDAAPAVARLAFSDATSVTRAVAAQLLAYIRGPVAKEAMLNLLFDPDGWVAYETGWYLGHLGDADTIPALVERVLQCEEGTRASDGTPVTPAEGAAQGLCILGEPCLAPLIAATEPTGGVALTMATFVASQIATPPALEFVRRMADHPDPMVADCARERLEILADCRFSRRCARHRPRGRVPSGTRLRRQCGRGRQGR